MESVWNNASTVAVDGMFWGLSGSSEAIIIQSMRVNGLCIIIILRPGTEFTLAVFGARLFWFL